MIAAPSVMFAAILLAICFCGKENGFSTKRKSTDETVRVAVLPIRARQMRKREKYGGEGNRR
jgi:hypothetical protein